MVCDECAKRKKNDKVSIYFCGQNYNTSTCQECKSNCEYGYKYCLLCAFKLGICEKCGNKIFDNSIYKYNDTDPKDYLRKKRSKITSNAVNKNLLNKKKLKVMANKTKKAKKNKIIGEIKITNYDLDNISHKKVEEGKEDDKNKKNKNDKEEEIQFFDE